MNRPHVTLKLATSLDGRIATASGESRWITGEAARAEVHRIRASVDAVMIGAGTARSDNPSLLARTEPLPARQPIRVVVSATLAIPTDGALFANRDQSRLVVLCRSDADTARRAALESAGAEVLEAQSLGAGLVALHLHGVERVLAEGGGGLAASLLARDVVDRLEWFRAPIILGADGRPAIAGLELGGLAEAPRFRRVALRELGPDVWESYERA